MNKELEKISYNMKELGLGALRHANRHAAYSDYSNDKWAELAVLQAAHAAEILIKARIAEEHPLLLFDSFPKVTDDNLSLDGLFYNGRTIEWSQLYSRLWATTNIKLHNKNLFNEFGKLRNGIQHFGNRPEDISPAYEALKFIYGIIDPLIYECWELYAIDYDEDDDPYEHLVPCLISYQIEFHVSPESAQYSDYWEEYLLDCEPEYQHKIRKRIKMAQTT